MAMAMGLEQENDELKARIAELEDRIDLHSAHENQNLEFLLARVAKLEAALKEIIQEDINFYDSCDYCYDEEEQCRADGKSIAYAVCREIAEEGLKP